MENKFTQEQIEKAKDCKTIEELLALAKENGIDLTEAQAISLFAQLNPENGELADSELEAVAGGGCFDDPCPQGGNHSWETTYQNQKVLIERCSRCHEVRETALEPWYNSSGI